MVIRARPDDHATLGVLTAACSTVELLRNGSPRILGSELVRPPAPARSGVLHRNCRQQLSSELSSQSARSGQLLGRWAYREHVDAWLARPYSEAIRCPSPRRSTPTTYTSSANSQLRRPGDQRHAHLDDR